MPGHADASTTEIYAHYAPDPTRRRGRAEGVWGSRRHAGRAGRVAAARALTALVGDPALEVGAQEPHVPADADAGEPVAAHRVVDPRDADGEECRRLVRSEQRLIQVRAWRAWIEFDLTMQEELRSRGVGVDLSAGRRRRPPADSLRGGRTPIGPCRQPSSSSRATASISRRSPVADPEHHDRALGPRAETRRILPRPPISLPKPPRIADFVAETHPSTKRVSATIEGHNAQQTRAISAPQPRFSVVTDEDFGTRRVIDDRRSPPSCSGSLPRRAAGARTADRVRAVRH